MKTLANFKVLVETCIAAAEERYGKMPPIGIHFNVKGKAAGWAINEGDSYHVRFNKEAIALDWDHMVKEIIPHEIAHIVGMTKPELGAKGHNYNWRQIARSLGCSGDRCHTIKLTPGRKVTKYRYVMSCGDVFEVGAKIHNKLQALGHLAGYRHRVTRELIDKHHYKGVVQ